MPETEPFVSGMAGRPLNEFDQPAAAEQRKIKLGDEEIPFEYGAVSQRMAQLESVRGDLARKLGEAEQRSQTADDLRVQVSQLQRQMEQKLADLQAAPATPAGPTQPAQPTVEAQWTDGMGHTWWRDSNGSVFDFDPETNQYVVRYQAPPPPPGPDPHLLDQVNQLTAAVQTLRDVNVGILEEFDERDFLQKHPSVDVEALKRARELDDELSGLSLEKIWKIHEADRLLAAGQEQLLKEQQDRDRNRELMAGAQPNAGASPINLPQPPPRRLEDLRNRPDFEEQLAKATRNLQEILGGLGTGATPQ